jgi:hypothetical protein
MKLAGWEAEYCVAGSNLGRHEVVVYEASPEVGSGSQCYLRLNEILAKISTLTTIRIQSNVMPIALTSIRIEKLHGL